MDSKALKNAKEVFASSKDFQNAISALNNGQSVLWEGCLGSSNALIGGEIVDRLGRPLIVIISKAKDLESVSNDFAIFSDSSSILPPLFFQTALPKNKTIK